MVLGPNRGISRRTGHRLSWTLHGERARSPRRKLAGGPGRGLPVSRSGQRPARCTMVYCGLPSLPQRTVRKGEQVEGSADRKTWPRSCVILFCPTGGRGQGGVQVSAFRTWLSMTPSFPRPCRNSRSIVVAIAIVIGSWPFSVSCAIG